MLMSMLIPSRHADNAGGRWSRAHLLLSLALAFPVVAFAGTQALEARASSAAALEPGTIEVALLQPTSGYFAAHNLALARGVTVATQELNKAGGIGGKIKIKLVNRRITETSDADRVVASLNGAVRAVILPCNIEAAPALARASTKRGLLALAPCNPDPTAMRGLQRYWPVAMSGDQQASQIVNYATSGTAKRAFILTSTPTPAYEASLAKQFRVAARRAGIRIVGQASVPLTAPKISDVVRTLRRTSAQIILTPIFSPYVANIAARLRASGVTIPVFATDGMDAQLTLSRYRGTKLKDVFFGSYGFPSPASRSFFRSYQRQFHSVPVGSFAALGLETVRTLATAVGKADSTDPAKLDAAFRKGFRVPGIGLAERQYLGGNARTPVAAVGVATVIRGKYYPLVSRVSTIVSR
jgi:branched-chain amino acid transport system substrate-binding protein